MQRSLLAPLLLVGIGCQPCDVEQATATGPDVIAITSWLDRYVAAVNNGDLGAWASFIADDAVVMPPDEHPISGMGRLRPLYETVFRTYAFDFRPDVNEVVVAGDLAVVRAFFEETVTPKGEGEPLALSGSWLAVLKKQPDGTWKMWRNMWGAIPAAPTEPPG
ncbi:MAG: DUF4440 domain-containing protein [Gemmatimonadales bacterium]|jgi:uncharacterized protein (TIGR02246 family)